MDYAALAAHVRVQLLAQMPDSWTLEEVAELDDDEAIRTGVAVGILGDSEDEEAA